MNEITIMPLIFIVGYLFKIFYKDISDSLIKIIITFFMPTLVIYLFQGLQITRDVYDVIILGYITFIIGTIIAIIVTKYYNLNKRTLGALVLAMGFGNTSFLGIPYIKSYYGIEGLQSLAFFDILGTSVPIFITAFILNNYCNNQKTNIILLPMQIALKPPIFAIFIGFYLKDTPIHPDIYEIMGFITSSIAPLAIFTIGMRFSAKTFKQELPAIGGILSVKMLVAPIIIFIIVYFIFDISQVPYQVAIIESALPPMILGSALAIRYNMHPSLVIGSVTLGVIVSFVSIPILHYLLSSYFPV